MPTVSCKLPARASRLPRSPSIAGGASSDRMTRRHARRHPVAGFSAGRPISTIALMQRTCLEGDEADLFRDHHEPLVRSVARALRIPEAVAEDAAGHAWMILVRNQPRRDHIAAWLRVVAIHEAIRLWDLEVDDVPYDPEDDERRSLPTLGLMVQAHELLEAVRELSPRQRQVLIPFAAGYTYEEIAAATGLSPRNVERVLRRARRCLREDLGIAVPADERPAWRAGGEPLSVAAA
jgi:RNA polymerase sigma factor (sigma-70 family)